MDKEWEQRNAEREREAEAKEARPEAWKKTHGDREVRCYLNEWAIKDAEGERVEELEVVALRRELDWAELWHLAWQRQVWCVLSRRKIDELSEKIKGEGVKGCSRF